MSKQQPGILAGGTILVVNKPRSFNIGRSLRRARDIWIASAFVRRSGWDLVKGDLIKAEARITLIAGLDFCQTDPSVLRDWIGGELARKGVRARVYVGDAAFHPKLFLVMGGDESFALVGSGNLSAGGLRDNVECFAYVHGAQAVRQIRAWLEEIATNRRLSAVLDSDTVNTYEPKWKKAAAARKKLQHYDTEARKRIQRSQEAYISNWREAVVDARRFFASARFRDWYKEHKDAAKRILYILHYPSFRFGRNAWAEFYGIPNLGRLRAANMAPAIAHPDLLRHALRILVDETRPVADRITAVLDPAAPSYVRQLGINAASKILACSQPGKWPVWNNPVRAALASFGYKTPRGATIGQKYATFAEAMKEFKHSARAKDMLALDCFLYDRGSTL